MCLCRRDVAYTPRSFIPSTSGSQSRRYVSPQCLPTPRALLDHQHAYCFQTGPSPNARFALWKRLLKVEAVQRAVLVELDEGEWKVRCDRRWYLTPAADP
jgi:hypothetical protein